MNIRVIRDIKMGPLLLLLVIFCTCNILASETSDPQMIGWAEIMHVYKYREYGNSAVLHFDVPEDVECLHFAMVADTKKISGGLRQCTIFDVTIFMKQGALPVVNPDGAAFPSTFVNITRSQSYSLEFKANGTTNNLTVSSPLAGHWFGIAFRSWTDPNHDKIEQQGLVPICECHLEIKAMVQKKKVAILELDKKHEIVLKENESLSHAYKFYMKSKTDKLSAAFEVPAECTTCSAVSILFDIDKLPNEDSYIEIVTFEENDKQIVNIRPRDNSWLYMIVRYNTSELSNATEIKLQFEIVSESQKIVTTPIIRKNTSSVENVTKTVMKNQTYDKAMNRNLHFKSGSVLSYEQYNLIKRSTGNSFSFSYELEPSSDNYVPKVLNLTKQLTVLKFDVDGADDMGGTLYFGFAINLKRVRKDSKNSNSTQKYLLIVCLNKDYFQIPSLPNKCLSSDYNMNNASVILNSTSLPGTYENIHLPFPELGSWYVSMGLFPSNYSQSNCSETCTTLNYLCSLDCSDKECKNICFNKTQSVKECEKCNVSSLSSNEKMIFNDEQVSKLNVTMMFLLSMAPCVDDSCGRNGDCNMYGSSGILYSACSCRNGYTGWDCTSGAHADSPALILLSTLLLTLSNLLFIASIYFAYKRQYYTEAVVYFFAMFFSTFYHACDSGEDLYTYCLFKRSVLKFCDFYSGLLSIWVTLVAMANISKQLVSICHMVGAVLLAFGTEYNKQSFWVFFVPSFAGISLVSASWGLKCKKTRQCFPAKPYTFIYFPIGMGLVITGLICYAFLETNSNYKYIHSLWHMIMASSIVCLLPSKESFFPKS